MKHYSVLLDETINILDIKKDGIYVDGTLGLGGHALKILKKLDKGHLFAFDLDINAINYCKEYLIDYKDKITYIHSNYANIKDKLYEYNITKVDGIILDLGVSSPQFDIATRGFSYRYDHKLDMRMDQSQVIDAKYIINNYSKEELVDILYKYSDEKDSYRIVNNIIKQREISSINTTLELVDIVKASKTNKELSKKGHPAKKTFQAIRIKVNNELDNLIHLLDNIDDLLYIDGVLAIISFHSIEDRIIKRYFNKLTKPTKVDKRLPIINIEVKEYKLINNKPIVPSDNEIIENNRSKSAKLRAIRRIKR